MACYPRDWDITTNCLDVETATNKFIKEYIDIINNIQNHVHLFSKIQKENTVDHSQNLKIN